MDKIFRIEMERVISDDWVVRYDNRFFQLEPSSRHYAPARGKVVVCEGSEGRVGIEYRGRAVPWREIAVPAKRSVPEARPAVERATLPTPSTAKRKWMSPADHPWRRAFLSGSGLRSALNARPSGSQGSAPAGTRKKSRNQNNTFKKGTLLKSFDTAKTRH